MIEERSIDYWRDYYLLHTRSTQYKRNVERAQAVVQKFLEQEPRSYCSISGGKDSTVLMHLVWSIAPETKMLSEKDDMDFPNELEYMHTLQARYSLNLDIITPPVKLWDVAMQHDFTEDIHSKGTAWSDEYFYGLLRKWQAEHDYTGAFLGLRRDESKGRYWNFVKRGEIYRNESWQQWVCTPIAIWSGKDVFAYLFQHDIPIMDVYFKTRFVGSPEDIRKSWILPGKSARKGQAQWLKYYYLEIFTRLSALNPQLRNYV